MYRLNYYTPTGPINRTIAFAAAVTAAHLPRPAFIFITRRIAHVARTTRRPRLRRYAQRLTWLVGDGMAIQVRNGRW